MFCSREKRKEKEEKNEAHQVLGSLSGKKGRRSLTFVPIRTSANEASHHLDFPHFSLSFARFFLPVRHVARADQTRKEAREGRGGRRRKIARNVPERESSALCFANIFFSPLSIEPPCNEV